MSYKLVLLKSVSNLFGRLNTKEILKVFKDKPISRATIVRILKDCREGKEQKIEKKQNYVLREPKNCCQVPKQGWTINTKIRYFKIWSPQNFDKKQRDLS